MVSTLVCASENFDNYLEQGKKMGKQKPKIQFNDQEIESITPKNMRGKNFDSDKAYKQMQETSYTKLNDSLT